jgi:hypothetical protein
MAAVLTKIPYIDLRGAFTTLDLVYVQRRQAHALIRAIKGTFGAASSVPSEVLLRMSDRISRRWLERSDNPYLWEITRIAEEIGEAGVFTLNACLEWGCTGGIWQSKAGPVLRRVLDWPFPKLGEMLVVLHQTGKVGTYYNVTWPGLAGVFQGVAPDRFAAAINQAPMRKLGAGLAGDWAAGKVAIGRGDGLPPSHLLRQVFETAPDYATAKDILCRSEIAVPAIFLLAGPEDGEGCVIERTECDFRVRELAKHGDASVCAANHFVMPPDGNDSGWRSRPIDSAGRYVQACNLPGEGGNFSWFVPPIANPNSRLAFAGRPRQGRLSLVGTEGATPVTEVFRLPLG